MTSATFLRFHPRDYLETYYSKIGSENHGLMEFFAKAYEGISDGALMLEFGGGPTIYPLISAAPKVSSIHFADYLESNLDEVRRWKRNSPKAFNWQKFVKKALNLEGCKKVSGKRIAEREEIIRKKMKKIVQCNAFLTDPIHQDLREHFDVINTNFVTESITSSRKTWERLIKNVCSMLKPGGTLIMTAIKDAKFYYVGDYKFPAVPITEADLIEVLTKLGFQETSFLLQSVPAEVMDENLKGYSGYKGLIFLKAKK